MYVLLHLLQIIIEKTVCILPVESFLYNISKYRGKCCGTIPVHMSRVPEAGIGQKLFPPLHKVEIQIHTAEFICKRLHIICGCLIILNSVQVSG